MSCLLQRRRPLSGVKGLNLGSRIACGLDRFREKGDIKSDTVCQVKSELLQRSFNVGATER